MRPASSQETRVGRDMPSSTAAWLVVSTSSTAGVGSLCSSTRPARIVSIDAAAAADDARTSFDVDTRAGRLARWPFAGSRARSGSRASRCPVYAEARFVVLSELAGGVGGSERDAVVLEAHLEGARGQLPVPMTCDRSGRLNR